jgi:hypothetical protein
MKNTTAICCNDHFSTIAARPTSSAAQPIVAKRRAMQALDGARHSSSSLLQLIGATRWCNVCPMLVQARALPGTGLDQALRAIVDCSFCAPLISAARAPDFLP